MLGLQDHGMMGTIAGVAAIFAFIAAGLMLALSFLGLWHSGRAKVTDQASTQPAATGTGTAPRQPVAVA